MEYVACAEPLRCVGLSAAAETLVQSTLKYKCANLFEHLSTRGDSQWHLGGC